MSETGISTQRTFAGMGLIPWLVKQCQALQLHVPTPIQSEAIPIILNSDNHILGSAETGTGKTAAFALPLLHFLSAEPYGVFSLVLTPSRELAYQILDQFIAFGAPMQIRADLLIGGERYFKQLQRLDSRTHILIGTPGRTRFIFESFEEARRAVRYLRFLVLDEADRVLGIDMKDDTMRIIAALNKSEPKRTRRILMFTATLNHDLMEVSHGLLPLLGITDQSSLTQCIPSFASLPMEDAPHDLTVQRDVTNSERFRLPTDIRHLYFPVNDHVKLPYLVCFLRVCSKKASAIIFVNSCMRCEVVRLTLQLLGFPVCSLNSLLPQRKRLESLAMFKAGIALYLVATDIAARGLDIPTVDLVIHYDMPKLTEVYVHRTGRTGRAGKCGEAIVFLTEDEVEFSQRISQRANVSFELFQHKKLNEEGILDILDEVGSAKVEAKATTRELYAKSAKERKENARANKRRIYSQVMRDTSRATGKRRDERRANYQKRKRE